jgi:predicted metal-dependent HD superfamily phosphohydrolase
MTSKDVGLAALALSVELPVGLEPALRAAYAQPPRAYHDFAHVGEVLGHFARVTSWRDREAVALAILFHDAVYVAGQSDNEARSAELAATLLEATPLARFVPRVQELVRLTARHGSLEPGQVDHDAALFLDCDMAILGAAPADYDRYERAIAEEYAFVPRELYRAGRARFLEKVLSGSHIFLSEQFRAEREAQARQNLHRALEQLR